MSEGDVAAKTIVVRPVPADRGWDTGAAALPFARGFARQRHARIESHTSGRGDGLAFTRTIDRPRGCDPGTRTLMEASDHAVRHEPGQDRSSAEIRLMRPLQSGLRLAAKMLRRATWVEGAMLLRLWNLMATSLSMSAIFVALQTRPGQIGLSPYFGTVWRPAVSPIEQRVDANDRFHGSLHVFLLRLLPNCQLHHRRLADA